MSDQRRGSAPIDRTGMASLPLIALIAALISMPVTAEPQPGNEPRARNVILFVGDGMGLSSVNAASILGYRAPQALYFHRMPHVAFADTSAAVQWVTDAAAAATAMATGRKTANSMVSAFPADGAGESGNAAKTILEYAEERGLSTGVISDSSLVNPLVSAFYAHQDDRSKFGAIFVQLLAPRFGDGVDIAIGPGRKAIWQSIGERSGTLASEFAAKGALLSDNLRDLDAAKSRRAVVVLDDPSFDLAATVEKTTTSLARNSKGFFLVVHSDCHLKDAERSLRCVLALDKIVQTTAEQHGADTLVLVTADHAYALRTHDTRAPKTDDFLSHVVVLDEHTGEEVPVLATGPGSDRVKGFVSNTKIFDWMMQAFGWRP